MVSCRAGWTELLSESTRKQGWERRPSSFLPFSFQCSWPKVFDDECKKAATGQLDFPACYPSYFPPPFPGALTSTPTTSMDASEAPDDTGLLPTEGMLPFSPYARETPKLITISLNHHRFGPFASGKGGIRVWVDSLCKVGAWSLFREPEGRSDEVVAPAHREEYGFVPSLAGLRLRRRALSLHRPAASLDARHPQEPADDTLPAQGLGQKPRQVRRLSSSLHDAHV